MWMYIELIRKFNACMLQWSNIELIIDELIKFWNERIKRWKNYKFNFKEDESLVCKEINENNEDNEKEANTRGNERNFASQWNICFKHDLPWYIYGEK